MTIQTDREAKILFQQMYQEQVIYDRLKKWMKVAKVRIQEVREELKEYENKNGRLQK